MKCHPLLFALALGACKESAAPPSANAMAPGRPMATNAQVIDFEKDTAGKAPAGFTAALTGKGQAGVWQVQEAAGAPSGSKVVVQTSDDKTNYRFPLLVYNGLQARDVDLSVRFQPVFGRVDQAAGLVWRYRDANNYYLVRANALEGNVVLYKVENGKRSDLPVKGGNRTYGVKAEVTKLAWSTLRVTARGSQFEVYLGDTKLFEVEDTTFPGAGRVGLWTKADSVTRFDDLRIANLDASKASSP